MMSDPRIAGTLQKPDTILKRLFLPSFAGILVLVLVVAAVSPIQSRDIFWHLATGRTIVQSGSIPTEDPFSFTMKGRPWRAHEWLSDLIFYALVSSGAGISGLIVLKCLCLALTFVLLFRMAAESGDAFPAFLLTLGAGLVCLPSFLVRPQLFTYVLFTLTSYALYSFPRRKLIYWYPVIAFLWSHLHGAFIFGHVLFFLFFVEKVVHFFVSVPSLDRRENSPSGKQALLKELRILVIVGIVAFATPLLNPEFFRVYTYPLEYLGQTLHKAYIYEWFPPNFQEELPTEVFLFILAGSFIWLPRHRLFHAAMLTIPFTHLALTSARNIPLWVIITVPIIMEARFPKFEGLQEQSLLRNMSTAVKDFSTRMSAMDPRGSIVLPTFLSLILIVILLTIPPFPDNPTGEHWINPLEFPCAAVEWLSAQQGTPRLFNDYDWGGYIIWKTQWPVYIDGRADLYIPEQFLEYFATIKPRNAEWQEVLDRWTISHVLIKKNAVLGETLRASGAWRLAYSDTTASIYTRNLEK